MSVRRVKEKKKLSQERIFKKKEEVSCCSDLWAELSNVALLRASNLEKQAKSIKQKENLKVVMMTMLQEWLLMKQKNVKSELKRREPLKWNSIQSMTTVETHIMMS